MIIGGKGAKSRRMIGFEYSPSVSGGHFWADYNLQLKLMQEVFGVESHFMVIHHFAIWLKPTGFFYASINAEPL